MSIFKWNSLYLLSQIYNSINSIGKEETYLFQGEKYPLINSIRLSEIIKFICILSRCLCRQHLLLLLLIKVSSYSSFFSYSSLFQLLLSPHSHIRVDGVGEGVSFVFVLWWKIRLGILICLLLFHSSTLLLAPLIYLM